MRSVNKPPKPKRGDWVDIAKRRARAARRLAALASAPALTRQQEDELVADYIAKHGVTRVHGTWSR